MIVIICKLIYTKVLIISIYAKYIFNNIFISIVYMIEYDYICCIRSNSYLYIFNDPGTEKKNDTKTDGAKRRSEYSEYYCAM